MHYKQLTLIVCFTSLLNGCADMYNSQPPAPVYGGYPEDPYGNDPYLGTPGEAVPQPPPVTETKPLEGLNKEPHMVEIKPELPPPAEKYTPQETSARNTRPLCAGNRPRTTRHAGIRTACRRNPTGRERCTATRRRSAKRIRRISAIGHVRPAIPAVGSLVMAANENARAAISIPPSPLLNGDRIEPRNATLYYKLAVLRLKQSKPRLAEDIARKAALLAVKDNTLKKHSWLLIANARELQNNPAGAQKAKAEAAKY